MKTPRKHAELIKAWADGAEIEFRWEPTQAWRTSTNPHWEPECEYRIKTEPKPDLTLFYFASDHVVQCSSKIHIHNLALTFDGTTGALKSAEIV